MDAVDRVFAEFQLVYNNQYHKAFPTTDKLEYAKRLWFPYLKDYTAQQILDAAHSAIKESEFLPTVRGVLKYLEVSALAAHGLPEVRRAYMEACNATHPKIDFHWSHPVVYFAGHECGWLFLESATEKQSFPVFQQHYKTLCERVQAGEMLVIPKNPALSTNVEKPMNKKDRRSALARLRKETGL
jgi:hypothetical protein